MREETLHDNRGHVASSDTEVQRLTLQDQCVADDGPEYWQG